MAYATLAQLQTYVGDAVALPDGASRLLERASELIDYVSLDRAKDMATSTHVVNAVCAQVEFWIHTDESHAVLAPSGSLSIGSVSMSNQPGQLAPRAKRYLLLANLLNRGVRA
jgi:hypothetical protein